MHTSWSSQGLVAHWLSSRGELLVIDQTVPFTDPFYRQSVLVERDRSLRVLQWNATGSHLLVGLSDGALLIFALKGGLVNEWECIYSETQGGPLVAAAWCENRRKFSWNMNAATSGSSNATSFVQSKSFHVDFVPVGRLGLVCAHEDGTVRTLVERATDGQLSFDICQWRLLAGPLLPSSVFGQRANGSMVFLAHEPEQTSILQIAGSGTGTIEAWQLRQQASVLHAVERFVWLDSKDIFVHLSLASSPATMLSLEHLPLDQSHSQNPSTGTRQSTLSLDQSHSQGPSAGTRQVALAVPVNRIIHSTRAAGYFLEGVDGSVVMLNMAGDVIKTLQLEQGPVGDSNDNVIAHSGLTVVSPNGLCLGRVVETDGFPLFRYTCVGDINHKNTSIIREFVGKMISSVLNGSDAWDIFQFIRRAVLNGMNRDDGAASGGFVSTVLSEWIGLLEMAGIPSRNFYGCLLEMFKYLSFDEQFHEAHQLVNVLVSFIAVEKIVLANARNLTEELLADGKSALHELEFPVETVPSLLPVHEAALRQLAVCLSGLAVTGEETASLALLLLNDEFCRLCNLCLGSTVSLISQLAIQRAPSSARPSNVTRFYEESATALQSRLDSLALLLSPDWSPATGPSAHLLIQGFLTTLRGDLQLQSKCTANVFTFLTEIVLDRASCRKVAGHVARVVSRYRGTHPVRTRHLPDSSAPLPRRTSQLTEVPRFRDATRGILVVMGRTSVVLGCRKCTRMTLCGSGRKSKGELIYGAPWQKSLWLSRCVCGSHRRLFDLNK